MLLVPLVIGFGALGSPEMTMIGSGAEVVQARFELDLVGRSRAIFALPPGRRTIRSFRWMPAPGTSDAWKSARLRLVWDGDDPEAAGIDLPLEQFVTAEDKSTDGPPRYLNRRPMPYRQTGRIVIDAEGPVRGSIRLDAGPGGSDLDDRGYLRAELLGEEDRLDDPEESPPLEIQEKEAGGAGPAVRYWYDRNPGPTSPEGRG